MALDFGTMTMVEGETYPDIGLTNCKLNGAFVDGTAFSSFVVECINTTTGTAGFTDKTTGITGAAGTADTPSFTITRTASDFGSLSAGMYLVELTATNTASSKPLKAQWRLRVIDEVT